MSRVGPIIFSHPKPRERLLSGCFVVTFRTSQRTTGKTHARAKRTGGKIADVTVELLDEVDPKSGLSTYFPFSGFNSTTSWRNAIREMHGGTPEQGWLYKVTPLTDNTDKRRRAER